MAKPKATKTIDAIRPENHIPLVVHFAKKMGGHRHVLDSEQFADGCLGLLRACQLYDPHRINPSTGKAAAFVTYASRSIIMAITKTHKARLAKFRGGMEAALSFTDWAVDGDEIPQEMTKADVEDTIECERLLNMLDARTALYVRRVIMENWSMQEVATAEGISRSRVGQIVLSGIDRLRAANGMPNRRETELAKRRVKR